MMGGPVARQLVIALDVAWILYAGLLYVLVVLAVVGLVELLRWMRRRP